MDKGVVLLAVAVFLVASPSQVVITPNLQQACIDLFKSSLSDECFGVSFLKSQFTFNFVFMNFFRLGATKMSTNVAIDLLRKRFVHLRTVHSSVDPIDYVEI